MNREVVARELVDCAFKVHSTLGPGLLETAYELAERGIEVKRQKLLPTHYGGVSIDAGYRRDLLLDD